MCRFLTVPAVEVVAVAVVLVKVEHLTDSCLVEPPPTRLSVYLLQDKARQSVGVGVAQHGPGHEQRSSKTGH